MTVGVGPNYRSVFDSLEYSGREVSPLWAISDIEDEKKVEEWLDNAILACQDYYRDYFQIQLDNLLIYKGIQWLAAERMANRALDKQGVSNVRNPRVVINHIADTVTQWVSRLTRYRPAVGIFPARAQQSDVDSAKISKNVLDFIWYDNRIDEKLQEFARQMKIFGEAYLWILWDPQKGPIHPDQIAARQAGQKVPVTDAEGNPVKNNKGEPIFIEHGVHIGDVDYQIDAPYHVFDQPCRQRKDIDWSIRWYLQDVEYLRAKHPDKADEIQISNEDIDPVYTGYRLDVGKLKNQVIVYELYHRSHEFMEQGRFIKRVKGCILENTRLPYEHGKIPYIYMQDIEIPDQIRGMSFIQQVFPIAHQINACASLIYKSLVLYAHPKIVAQEGSVDIQQLLNESTVVFYSGGVPPNLLTQSPITESLFKHMEVLEKVYDKLSGIFTMSRGEAPSGVRAAKALRVLEEQEDKRAYITATKYNNIGLVENARMTLSVAGSFYKDEDQRLLQIVGKDNEYKILTFTTSNLTTPFHFRIENTTALSQSPAARIEELNEIMAVPFNPQAPISREQYIQLLGLTADEQFKDIVTRAIRCAQSENDDLIAGRPVQPPRETEDLIAHWKIHVQIMQSREYKEMYPEQIQAAIQQHLYVTEYLMHEKGFGITTSQGMPLRMPNLTFQQRLMIEAPDFPLLLKTPVAMPMMGMPSMAGGAMPPPQGMPGMDMGAPVAPPAMPQPPSSNVR